MAYKQPLSVFFVYHPKDKARIENCISFCYKSLQRDADKPYSRFINIPVFHNTSLDNTIPQEFYSQSNETIAFMLISKYSLTNDRWNEYYNKLCGNKNIKVVLIVLDACAINFEYCKTINAIRAYQFNPEYYEEEFLINVAHEIYRWVLCKNDIISENKEISAIKIFLSHTKQDEIGKEIAIKIKSFIDNRNFSRFFDATDIPPATEFCKIIKENIEDSTLLAIHTDPYSSKYWCQKEILCAKELNRPIIAIDCLQEYEDRRFPHASNIAALHFDMSEPLNLTEKDLYKIIISALLETLRFHYSKLLLDTYKQTGFIGEDDIILSRPPEFCDIEKVISYDGEKYISKSKNFCYPDPFIYDLELEYFKKLGIKSYTPTSANINIYNNLKIGLSISELIESEIIHTGQFKEHLIHLSQDLARYLLTANATLVYGGDLREGGFTNFIFDEALILQNRFQKEIQPIENYIAFPIYTKNDEEIIDWKARYIKVAKMNNVDPPKDIKDACGDCKTFIIPNSTPNKYIWSRSLTNMRETMIDNCDIRICAGGKHSGYKGCMPGVLEEVLIAVEKKKPLYLLGGFGGVVSDVCEIIETGQLPAKLTQDWQIKNNENYEDLLKYIDEQGMNKYEYNKLTDILKWEILETNGLTEEENIELFKTPFIEKAVYLVIKGLNNITQQINKLDS